MLKNIGIPSQFKRVIQNISGSTAFNLLDPPTFANLQELYNANKSTVIQGTKCFTETPIDSFKCVAVITKILYLLQQGITFGREEKLKIFFSTTRLFQSEYAHMRMMVYLLIKALEPPADVAFVVTSSLTKDMAGANDNFRTNALRTIVKIVDSQTAQQSERFLKAAVVSNNPLVASTALLCGIQLLNVAPEMVRRWVSEVSECVTSKHPMVQFHALALLHELKKHDRLALHRIIATLTSKVTKSPIAECLLIRYATQLLISEPDDSPLDASSLMFLEASLSHHSDVVAFEAAKAFVTLGLEASDKFFSDTGTPKPGFNFEAALSTLRLLLVNARDVVRFAAIRVFHKISQVRASLLRGSLVDIEPLISDSCRAVAVLALLVMLKISGPDNDADKLIKQINSVMLDVSESQRIEIVTALYHMCLSHSERTKSVVGFLSSHLRDEGGRLSKTHTVEALCRLARAEDADVHESTLAHLCDFIEDCEYQQICCYILTFLAAEVPRTANPVKFLRYIYNRILLENVNVRAAAIHALTRIALEVESVRPDVYIMLNGSVIGDSEDEIRERAAASIKAIRTASQNESKITDSIIADDLIRSVNGYDSDAPTAASMEDLLQYETDELDFSVDAMVEELIVRINDGQETVPLNLDELPSQEEYEQKRAAVMASGRNTSARPTAVSEDAFTPLEIGNASQSAGLFPSGGAFSSNEPGLGTGRAGTSSVRQSIADRIACLLPAGEDASSLGTLHHQSKPQELTENEAEYVVAVVKHFWTNVKYVSFEVRVRNTLEKQALEDIDLRMGINPQESNNFEIVAQSAIAELGYGEVKSLYVLLRQIGDDGAGDINGESHLHKTFSCASQLAFKVKEEGCYSYDDTYEMEPISISMGDYLSPLRKHAREFQSAWNILGGGNEEIVKLQFARSRGGVSNLCDKLKNTLPLHACEGWEQLAEYADDPAGGVHSSNRGRLLLIGQAVGSPYPVLINAQMVESPVHGVLGKISIRSEDSHLRYIIADTVKNI